MKNTDINVKFIFSYDGSKFFGSQQQTSTDQTVYTKFLNILKKYNINSKLIISSRTDKGVHALNQCANIYIPTYWSDFEKLKKTLNRSLYPSIFIKKIEVVNDHFHSRYSAVSRTYRYIITDKKNIFKDSYETFVDTCFDIDRLNTILHEFIGVHNFKYFQSDSSTNNYTRQIYKCFAYKYNNYTIFKISANGFLRNQIRYMIGAVLAVYFGQITLKDLSEQIDVKQLHIKRKKSPHGLYLTSIKY